MDHETLVSKTYSDDEFAAKLGEKIASRLNLKPDYKESLPYGCPVYILDSGPKTTVGLARTVIGLIETFKNKS